MTECGFVYPASLVARDTLLSSYLSIQANGVPSPAPGQVESAPEVRTTERLAEVNVKQIARDASPVLSRGNLLEESFPLKEPSMPARMSERTAFVEEKLSTPSKDAMAGWAGGAKASVIAAKESLAAEHAISEAPRDRSWTGP